MKKCFLCGEKSKTIDFNEQSFQNCYLKIQFRQKNGFMYGNVHFTKKSLDDSGYHTQCYQKVTVLKSKFKEQYMKFVENFEVSKLLYKYTFYCVITIN